jgi:hypothetical protein
VEGFGIADHLVIAASPPAAEVLAELVAHVLKVWLSAHFYYFLNKIFAVGP